MLDERGAALIDALIAVTLLAIGVLAFAHLLALAAAANVTSRQTTVSTTLAAQKVEEIRADPAAMSAVDYPLNGAYRRRWTIDPLPGGSSRCVVVHVVVAPASVPERAPASPGMARLTTVVTRTTP
jgi:type IV pilus modification protein PilV